MLWIGTSSHWLGTFLKWSPHNVSTVFFCKILDAKPEKHNTDILMGSILEHRYWMGGQISISATSWYRHGAPDLRHFHWGKRIIVLISVNTTQWSTCLKANGTRALQNNTVTFMAYLIAEDSTVCSTVCSGKQLSNNHSSAWGKSQVIGVSFTKGQKWGTVSKLWRHHITRDLSPSEIEALGSHMV